MLSIYNVIATETVEGEKSPTIYTNYSYAENDGIIYAAEKFDIKRWELIHSRAFSSPEGIAKDIHKRIQTQGKNTKAKIVSDLSEKYREIEGDFRFGEGIHYNNRTGEIINVRTLSAEEKSSLVKELFFLHKIESTKFK
jgi:hypothetical protein